MTNWLPQTGIGIRMDADRLRAFCLRRFAGRARISDRLEISAGELGAARCGSLYREFLRRNGLKNPWTVVVLPRSMVLWRQLHLPSSIAGELRHAVEFQLDSLHPFDEGGIWWDCAGLAEPSRRASWLPGASEDGPAQLDVCVAMAERKHVEEFADWFREAGIPISQFAPSTALFVGLLNRMRSSTSGAPFMLDVQAERAELAGLTPGGAAVSREIIFDSADEERRAASVMKELSLARSELRLGPEEPIVLYTAGTPLLGNSAAALSNLGVRTVSVQELFGNALATDQDTDAAENAAGLAAALAAVEHDGTFALNLLPPERRIYQSPTAYVPTYALAGLVIILAAAMGLRAPVQDWLYSRSLEHQRQALAPQIQEMEKRNTHDRQVFERLAELAQLNLSAGLPLQIMDELTRIMPPDAWLQNLQYDGTSVTLAGSAGSASGVLQALANSNQLQAPQFLSAVTRSNDGKEGFRIAARLRDVNP